MYLDNPQSGFNTGLGSVTFNGDNVYLYFAALNMAGREGLFFLEHSIYVMTGIPEDTADLEEGGSGIVLFTPSSYGSLGFTLKKGTGASLTDLVAGTANTSCADVPFSWPLTITSLLNQTCSGRAHEPVVPGETCVFLANDTRGVVADYDSQAPFVNMTTTGFGCAPTMDKAAAAVESNVAALSCFLPGSTAVCGTNATNVPHSGFTPIYVPGEAAVMAIITGVVAGALLI